MFYVTFGVFPLKFKRFDILIKEWIKKVWKIITKTIP